MKVVVIRYNAGNIQSVAFALERLGVEFTVSDNPEEIAAADKVIFPGVGEAGTTMRYLKDRKLDKLIVDLRQPVLGICLGMQLMCKHSTENNTPCLGIFDCSVEKFIPTSESKVPHMGWNNLTDIKGWHSPELQNQFVYFVHSYFVPLSEYTTATTRYILEFSAAMRKNNFYAVQFHPEKSSRTGELVLQNFLSV
jgi:imidazole glycerol-phosphate synthase subunit HisH